MNTFLKSTSSYISNQIEIFKLYSSDNFSFHDEILKAKQKMDFLFLNINDKYSKTNFGLEHLWHSDYYAIFLYWLSHLLFLNQREDLATKIFLLNKMLHGIDLYYTRKMPEIFIFSHPIGTILGDAQYSDLLCVSQNCTIGGGGI